MKLLRLSLLSIVGCVLGLAVLVSMTTASYSRLQGAQQELGNLLELHRRLDTFSAASDALSVQGADAELWRLFVDEAQALRRELRGLDNSDAQRAADRIDEIVTDVEQVRTTDAATDLGLPGGPLGLPIRTRVILNEVAGHGVALDTAVDSVLRQRQRALARQTLWIGGGFAAAALLFGSICVLTFLLIHRRMAGPMRSLSGTIHDLTAGRGETRARVTGNDEFAELSAAFNGLADQRQAAIADLEHNRRMLAESQRIAGIGSWQMHLPDMALTWSEETYRLLGAEPYAFEPTPDIFFGYIHPDDRERARAEIDHVLASHEPYELEFRIVRDDGEVRRVHERAVTEYDANGEPRYLTGTIQDVTDQRSLTDYLSQFRRLIEASTDRFAVIDSDLRYTMCNEAYAALFQRDCATVEGRHLCEVLGPLFGHDFVDREMRPYIERCLAGEPQTIETQRTYPHMGTREVLIRYYPLPGPDSEVHQVGMVMTDMTDLKRAEANLRQALETRQALINGLPAHIALIDGAANILDVNDRWRHFARENGYQDGDYGVGCNYLAVCEAASGDSSEEAGAAREGLHAVLSGERETFTLEYPCHPPEQQRWFRMMARRLSGSSGDVGEAAAVVMHVDVTERKLAELELNRLAYEDALTSMPSRNGFLRGLETHVRTSGWQPEAMVVVLDVRSLRDINDVHGYAVGDGLLQAIAQRLQDQAGADAVVARIGGDEFAIFLPDRPDASADEQRAAIAEAFGHPFRVESLSIEASALYGYTRLGSEQRDCENLLREAELALFQSGRHETGSSWMAYTSVLHDEARERTRLTRDLRRALERDEFQLHFQPKVDLRSGRLVGSEALLRWMHPEFGLQSPASFITAAERSQLIGPIGEWAIHEACRCLSAWNRQGLELVQVAVNVSLIQFMVGDLTETVRRALAEHGVSPRSLTLEITESVFERESDSLLRQLRALHEMGVRLSLDDFGTGYSSLLYLQKYPFDEIKIDRGFVQRMLADEYSAKIVTTVIGIAAGLNAEAIAEGVETAAVRDSLIANGCYTGQGYYFSMPLESEDFRWLLERRSTLPVGADE